MKLLQHQKGSSHLVLILAVTVLAAVGVIGYRVTQNGTDTSVASTSVAPVKNSDAPDKIQSAADLKQAEASLDSDAIDSKVNPNQLDSNIDALL